MTGRIYFTLFTHNIMKQEVYCSMLACIMTISAAETVIPETVVNETLNSLLGESSSIVDSKKVMATTDGIFRIFTVLNTAISLSLYFFKYLFGFIFRIVTYIISPFFWIIKFCWNQFVSKPFDLLLYVLHVLYPVLMFCLAAICCGVFIGGCAGFAAEAFSSILISATWGPQPLRIKQEEELDDQEQLPPNKNTMKEFTETEDEEEEEEPFHQKQQQPKKTKPLSSRSSSISSFFSSVTPKGKEPLKRPFIDQWSSATSFSHTPQHPTSSSSSSSINPVFIRRMKLSSTNEDRPKIKSRTNSWEWDEDEDL